MNEKDKRINLKRKKGNDCDTEITLPKKEEIYRINDTVKIT